MRHFMGLRDAAQGSIKGPLEVFYEPARLVTGHTMIAGMSGTGKSHESRRLLSAAAESGMQIDVFDVHDEFDDIPGSVAVKYSQHTKFGYNPLAIDSDIHSGGPQKQTDFLVGLIKQVSTWLGIQQETVLRNLCEDTYAACGIFQDNPGTWCRQHISEQERLRLIGSRQYAELRRYYPTLEDLRSFANRKINALALGGDNKCVTQWNELSTNIKKLSRLNSKYNKGGTEAEMEKLRLRIGDCKAAYKESMSGFVDALETGRELDDILKYKSMDLLQSIVSRIDLLNTTGIFRANLPPFGRTNIRIHQLKSLSPEQQFLFIKLRVARICEHLKRRGPIAKDAPPTHIVYIEEAHKVFVNDPGDVLNVAAKEFRKFGLAIVASSQQPTDFPKDFLTNVGMTVLCGIHQSYWKSSASLLGTSTEVLSKVRPKEVIAIKLQRPQETNPSFMTVAVPNTGTLMGRRAHSVSAAK